MADSIFLTPQDGIPFEQSPWQDSNETHGKSIAIDLDGTLATKLETGPGEPLPGALEAVQKLKEGGFEIIIFSHRVTHPGGLRQVIDWLQKYKIPYDRIWLSKPPADYFIDDRAISFTDWDKVYQEVNNRKVTAKANPVIHQFEYSGTIMYKSNFKKPCNWLTSTVAGLSKGMTVEDIAKKHKVSVEHIEQQLEIGIKVEKEHTDSETTARRIALDHLVEDPDYYTKLKKMERSGGFPTVQDPSPDTAENSTSWLLPKNPIAPGTPVSGPDPEGMGAPRPPGDSVGKGTDDAKILMELYLQRFEDPTHSNISCTPEEI